MATSLLSLVQSIVSELGLPSVNAVVSNRSRDVVQVLSLMNAAGTELMAEHEWRKIVRKHIITVEQYSLTGTTVDGSTIVTGVDTTNLVATPTVFSVTGSGVAEDSEILSIDGTSVTLNRPATASGTTVALTFSKVKYPFPSDYDSIINQTQWRSSATRSMVGPVTPQMWEQLHQGVSSTSLVFWRLLGDYFQIFAPVAHGSTLFFEYLSNGWVTDVAGTMKTKFSVDTDTCIYTDRLIINFTKMKYFDIKGFDSTKMERDYIRALRSAQAKSEGADTVSMTGESTLNAGMIGSHNLLDTGYG